MAQSRNAGFIRRGGLYDFIKCGGKLHLQYNSIGRNGINNENFALHAGCVLWWVVLVIDFERRLVNKEFRKRLNSG